MLRVVAQPLPALYTSNAVDCVREQGHGPDAKHDLKAKRNPLKWRGACAPRACIPRSELPKEGREHGIGERGCECEQYSALTDSASLGESRLPRAPCLGFLSCVSCEFAGVCLRASNMLVCVLAVYQIIRQETDNPPHWAGPTKKAPFPAATTHPEGRRAGAGISRESPSPENGPLHESLWDMKH